MEHQGAIGLHTTLSSGDSAACYLLGVALNTFLPPLGEGGDKRKKRPQEELTTSLQIEKDR